jgi:hypothetical protein
MAKKKHLLQRQSGGHVVHIFGSDHPHGMPEHFLHGAVDIDYDSAVRADTSRQDYSVAPRYWYLDLTFVCQRCKQRFVWTRDEQRFWFEELRFWIDSHPSLCRQCRATKREMSELRRAYDSGISSALSCKAIPEKEVMRQILADYLTLAGVLSPRMVENLDLLERQIQNLSSTGG